MRVICMLTTLVLLVVFAGCSGTGETGMSYEQFRQKVEGLHSDGSSTGPVNKGDLNWYGWPIAKYKEALGQPEKEQATEGRYILYYRVREGRAQVILEGTPEVGYRVVRPDGVNLW